MRDILQIFENQMKNIKNTLFTCFFSYNFINQRVIQPFTKPIPIYAEITADPIQPDLINNMSGDELNEYGCSIRRHFLNDMVIVYERYCSWMYTSHNNRQILTDPSTINDRRPNAPRFERIPNIYTTDDKNFLKQLHNLRNSIVHYNGKYTVSNVLNYTFGTQAYNSVGHEGEDITINYDNLIWIYEYLLEIVKSGNSNYFTHYVD